VPVPDAAAVVVMDTARAPLARGERLQREARGLRARGPALGADAAGDPGAARRDGRRARGRGVRLDAHGRKRARHVVAEIARPQRSPRPSRAAISWPPDADEGLAHEPARPLRGLLRGARPRHPRSPAASPPASGRAHDGRRLRRLRDRARRGRRRGAFCEEVLFGYKATFDCPRRSTPAGPWPARGCWSRLRAHPVETASRPLPAARATWR
jgi:hypothetical protein